MKLYNALNRLSLSLPGGKTSLDTTKGKKKPLIFHQLARTGGGGLGGYRWQQIGGWWWPHREEEDGSRVPLGRRSGGGGGGDGGGNGGGGAGEDDNSDDEQDPFADDDEIVWRDNNNGLQCIIVTPRLDLPNNPDAIVEKLERVIWDMSRFTAGSKGTRAFREHFCRTGEEIANETLVKFSSKKISRRAMVVIENIHSALTKDRNKMLRGIYYSSTGMFSKDDHGKEIDKILRQLAVGLDVPVRAFGVLTETKTKYDGQLKFIYNRGKEDETVYDIQDTNNQIHHETGFTPNRRIQHNRDGIRPLDPLGRTVHMASPAKVVLVVEDGQTFNLIKSDKMWDDKSVSVLDQEGQPVLDDNNQPRTRIVRGVPMILVCTHGKPDYVGREFVADLESKFEVPVVMWSDFNVGGVDCADQFDTERDDADDRTKVGWLGMRLSQFQALGLDPSKLKQSHAKFGRHRKGRLANHLAKKTSWLPNAVHRDGNDQAIENSPREKAMKAMKSFNHGVETEQVDDDLWLTYIRKQLTLFLAQGYDPEDEIVI